MNKRIVHLITTYTVYVMFFEALQLFTVDHINLNGVIPDYLFVFTILVGFLYGTTDAIVIGLVSGFLRDAFSGRNIGIGMLLFLYCGLFASFFLRKTLSKNILTALLQVGVASVLYIVAVFIYALAFNLTVTTPYEYLVWTLENRILQILAVNLVTGLMIYIMLKIVNPYKVKESQYKEERISIGEKAW